MPKTRPPVIALSDEIKALELEDYVLQLEVDGLAVIPPEVHGVPMSVFDAMGEALMQRAEVLCGCPFSIDRGAHEKLDYSGQGAFFGSDNEISMVELERVVRLGREFRDLAVHPVAIALCRHMVGQQNLRFSSFNGFLKWQDPIGYGPDMMMHSDSGGPLGSPSQGTSSHTVPLPWGTTSYHANAIWTITDFTKEDGATAYVPGSHRFGTPPVLPMAAELAIPAVAPKGSLIIFHGCTWHGAFPRLNSGMRLAYSCFYRHRMIMPQENVRASYSPDFGDDSNDPALFRELIGCDDHFPYSDNDVLTAVPKVRPKVKT